MKRLLNVLLVFLLLIQFVGCQKKEEVIVVDEPEELFLEYTQRFVQEYYSETDFGINFDFEHPEDYGIIKGLYEFTGITKEDYDDYMASLEKEITYLKRYDYNNLTAEEKWTYDLILDTLEREYGLKDYFLYESSGFGSINGVNNNLPLLLDEFTFNDKQDVDSYINLLKTAKIMFSSYLENEYLRQEEGYGLSQFTIDNIIEQCDTILSETDYFLEDSFNQRIDAVDFLTEAEKSEYKILNKTHLYGDYYEAYQLLKDGMLTLDGAKYDNQTLADSKEGQQYYKALIKSAIGVEMTPAEIDKYLDAYISKVLREYIPLYNEHGDSLYGDYKFYSAADSVEDVVDYLYEVVLEDFPFLEKSEIDIKTVDESMQESFSPAAYLVTKYDAPVSSREVILINGLYDDYDFTTYAHEGYPGHLYQNVYYKSLDLNMVNYILSNIGYTEGWAVYAEQYALKYSDLPEASKEAYYLDNVYVFALMCKLELLIHYHGYDSEQFYNYVSGYFTIDREGSDYTYGLLRELPSYYLYYNFSYLLIEDMKTDMQNVYGNSFTDYQFHEFMLNHGNGSIGLLQEKLKEELSK